MEATKYMKAFEDFDQDMPEADENYQTLAETIDKMENIMKLTHPREVA